MLQLFGEVHELVSKRKCENIKLSFGDVLLREKQTPARMNQS